MADKAENGYYVLIKSYSGGIVKTLGPYQSISQADRAERGVERNLNHADYYTISAWFGPDPEPTT
jgi:hypothetical protein